ncbi:MAG: hypothetical protein BMS9Abin37_1268 [Acidobacteriota bacterium]|nr:MAG: hypothetical protein BMS9Abin37_1268 [Acidobacteriota bacterium]
MRKLVIALFAALVVACTDPPPEPELDVLEGSGKHVQLLHLDGYRSDLTRTLLEAGRLPRLAELAARGRISYQATTVDKSETMKVIQSYLTSQLDTRVAGWWQFDRSRFRFANYWLDPAEVLNYALGLEFPVSPTIQDFLAARGRNLVAGMSLARRSVPFENYGRAYLEGVAAVSAHTYHAQADATTKSFLEIHRRIARNGEQPPALSTLLLAAADEFSHAYGVTTARDEAVHCFRRDDDDMDGTVFRLLSEDSTLGDFETRYFARVTRSHGGAIDEVCIDLPWIEGRRAEPRYVLSMIVVDIEIGYVIDFFKAVRFDDGKSLFDRTLFIVFGDHGMVDTANGMVDLAGGESFITYLNRRLELETGQRATALPDGVELGIDYQQLPRRLRQPESYREWQSEDIRALTQEADSWSQGFYEEARELLLNDVRASYWWLFFLRGLLVDPKVDEALGPVAEQALATFRNLYLRARLEYLAAEIEANREFFDRNVRLVYGGGARNNAEIFIPVCGADRACSWERRPSYDEILGYRNDSLMEALVASPGVGLIFVRRHNEAYAAGARLPAQLEVEVRDREGHRGLIAVHRDAATSELVFHYRTDPSSEADPLGYEAWGRGDGTFGTYNEWNDRTIDNDYVNVVGGMGTYLYSTNPAIGDVVVMHATGWNFGENLGGHGGVHGGEKRTVMLVSGPGVGPGELRARARHATTEDGSVVEVEGKTHVPTLLDIVPSALSFLGYAPDELDAFAENEFEPYLDEWIRSQHDDILDHFATMSSVEKAKDEAGLPELSLEPLMPRISRLLDFLGTSREETLTRLAPRPTLGNELILE